MSDKSEYLKYMTERVVSYMESPDKDKIRQAKKAAREPWATRWFGMLPMGIMMWWKRRGERKKNDRTASRSVNPPGYR